MHIQWTVSTYLYLLYVTQEDTNQNAVSACKSGQFFYIGHSLFDIRRKVGYLLDIQNIGHSKFDIHILMK